MPSRSIHLSHIIPQNHLPVRSGYQQGHCVVVEIVESVALLFLRKNIKKIWWVAENVVLLHSLLRDENSIKSIAETSIKALFGAWRSWLAHLHGVQGVGSSSLLAPTELKVLQLKNLLLYIKIYKQRIVCQ